MPKLPIETSRSNNKSIVDIGKHSSKDSKQIIKKEMEMVGSSKGRVTPIPNTENGPTLHNLNSKPSLTSQMSIHFTKGSNIEDASDEVGYSLIFVN